MSEGRARPSLTTRQEEIIYLLPGRSYRQIGDALGITTRTVKYHMDVLRHRFGVDTKNELIAELRDQHILE